MNLKPTHKIVKDYYNELQEYKQLGITHEGAVSAAFHKILASCGRQQDWILVTQHRMTSRKKTQISVDGALLDKFRIPLGYWEAKDMRDDLPTELTRKFDAGYPNDNIIFQTPERAILWQNNLQVLDADLNDKTQLIETLQTFFAYSPPEYLEWEKAVEDFKKAVPQVGESLGELIRDERKSNQAFATVFVAFHERCRQSLNPNLSEAAVEEMLIQHLLTERIFRTVFSNSDFVHRNVIAREIESVINALTSQAFSRDSFLQSLEHFYAAIERNATRISDFYEKQGFLNAVYEHFFQSFSVKVADTHGIVYTPQPIVDFMVKSVEHILAAEFNRSLSDSGVHIIDPFVGTGNFIVRIMREIRKTTLEDKYTEDLHCNEVMLLPYYIASMNIEHQFFEATKQYLPFKGICLVDTFDLPDNLQTSFLEPENAQRVENQKNTPMFVVIGNPPYNMRQVNENDNNKNRNYEAMDEMVRAKYTADSKARLRSKLSDPYVKAIRWATERVGDEGVVAFITNSGFLDGVAFDGMRKHLAEDFDAIYVLDLGGNARKGVKASDGNVFDIRVGVSINFFVKTNQNQSNTSRIHYHRVNELWNKKQKLDFLEERQHIGTIAWQSIQPDQRFTWFTEGLNAEFDSFIPMAQSERNLNGRESTIFGMYSLGVVTSRDYLAYSFNLRSLREQVRQFIEIYNIALDRKARHHPNTPIESLIDTTDTRIKWSHRVKQSLKKLQLSNYEESHFRSSFYRPFTQKYIYFDHFWNERRYQQYRIFPTPRTELENQVICVSGLGHDIFRCHIANQVVEYKFSNSSNGGTQCFPFYTYDADGSNRSENITDWALGQFRTHYQDDTITKWSIFHYIYALLHHPEYQERYAANLKRDLPRVPYTANFRAFAEAGARLSEIHVGYEDVDEYSALRSVETPDLPLDWRVAKMKLSKDKTQIKYNDFLTLDGIPSKAFEYRLGNRSALEWIINQYCVTPEKHGDPNCDDDPQYIVRLIRKVITVSLETVEIVGALPEWAD